MIAEVVEALIRAAATQYACEVRSSTRGWFYGNLTVHVAAESVRYGLVLRSVDGAVAGFYLA